MNIKDMPVRYFVLDILDTLNLTTSDLKQRQIDALENILREIYSSAVEESIIQENL